MDPWASLRGVVRGLAMAGVLGVVQILTSATPAAAADGATTEVSRGTEPSDSALQDWFAATLKDGTNAGAWTVRRSLTRSEAERWTVRVAAAYRAGAKAAGLDRLLPAPAPVISTNAVGGAGGNSPAPGNRAQAGAGRLELGTNVMPFVFWSKGTKPSGGWPLYIALHGGGGNGRAAGPHAWDVNSREWQAQQRLTERVYPSPGLYFIPRMADDRKGRWYHEHNQQAWDQVIRAAILFHGADPNRVYLLGISEGGYGAIRFAGNRPDRFAALNGMAAAEPLDTSPPENMRNVGLRIDIGEQDTMFDRVGLARRMGARLAELKLADPAGYDFSIDVQAGRGHGIRYDAGPRWLSERRRQPWPDRVNWTVRPFDRQVALQHYWLALPARPERMPLFLTASVRSNVVNLTAETLGEDKKSRVPATTGTVLVRLNETLADLDAPVTVTVNGRTLPALRPERRLETLVRTMAERGDTHYLFAAELEIPLAPVDGTGQRTNARKAAD